MRARTVLIVAMQSAITVALAGIALAWIAELGEDRARYELAQAEWQAASVALELAQRPDVERARRAAEEEARSDATEMRTVELCAAHDALRRRLDLMASRRRALEAEHGLRCRVIEAIGVPDDGDIAELARARRLRDDAVAMREVSRVHLRVTEDEVASAPGQIAAMGARRAAYEFLADKYQALLRNEGTLPRPSPAPLARTRFMKMRWIILGIGGVELEGGILVADPTAGRAHEGMRFAILRGTDLVCAARIKTVEPHRTSFWVMPDTLRPGRLPQRGDLLVNVR